MNTRRQRTYNSGSNNSSNGNGSGRRGSRGRYRGNGRSNNQASAADPDYITPRQRTQAINNRDKYLAQAREARQAGDRVKAEYLLQHADHYARIVDLSDEQKEAREAARRANSSSSSAPQNKEHSDKEEITAANNSVADGGVTEADGLDSCMASSSSDTEIKNDISSPERNIGDDSGLQLEGLLPIPKEEKASSDSEVAA